MATETYQEMVQRLSAKEISWAHRNSERFEFLRLDSEKGVGSGGYTSLLAIAVFRDRETGKEFGTSNFLARSGEVWDAQAIDANKLEHAPPALPMPKFKSTGIFLGFLKKSGGEWMSGYYT